jgi:hypothetical protein
MRPAFLGLATSAWPICIAALAILAACASANPEPVLSCSSYSAGCVCGLVAPGGMALAGEPSTSECNPTGFPGTSCCADPDWPSQGQCACVSDVVGCGVVPGYTPAVDGGSASDACVCSSDRPDPAQVPGATCYPGGTTTSNNALGTCCFFSASAPGSVGVASCVCAAGLHTCPNGTEVTSCSAASFPASVSCSGTPVASCSP